MHNFDNHKDTATSSPKKLKVVQISDSDGQSLYRVESLDGSEHYATYENISEAIDHFVGAAADRARHQKITELTVEADDCA